MTLTIATQFINSVLSMKDVGLSHLREGLGLYGAVMQYYILRELRKSERLGAVAELSWLWRTDAVDGGSCAARLLASVEEMRKAAAVRTAAAVRAINNESDFDDSVSGDEKVARDQERVNEWSAFYTTELLDEAECAALDALAHDARALAHDLENLLAYYETFRDALAAKGAPVRKHLDALAVRIGDDEVAALLRLLRREFAGKNVDLLKSGPPDEVARVLREAVKPPAGCFVAAVSIQNDGAPALVDLLRGADFANADVAVLMRRACGERDAKRSHDSDSDEPPAKRHCE